MDQRLDPKYVCCECKQPMEAGTVFESPPGDPGKPQAMCDKCMREAFKAWREQIQRNKQ